MLLWFIVLSLNLMHTFSDKELNIIRYLGTDEH